MAAGAAIAASPAASLARSLSRRTAPRIAIVGAGLAGLRCAHMLWNESPGGPIAATVYEANPERAGGRCWTLRDYFQNGLETEHGGSFLNSNQKAVRRLAAKLGLQEEVVDGGDLPQGEEVFFIDGAPLHRGGSERRLGRGRLCGVQPGHARRRNLQRAKPGWTPCPCPNGSKARRSVRTAASEG